MTSHADNGLTGENGDTQTTWKVQLGKRWSPAYTIDQLRDLILQGVVTKSSTLQASDAEVTIEAGSIADLWPEHPQESVTPVDHRLVRSDFIIPGIIAALYILAVVLHLVGFGHRWMMHELALFGLLWCASLPTAVPVVLAAVLLFIDARSIGAGALARNPLPASRHERMGAVMWTLHVLILFPIYAPLYVISRPRIRSLSAQAQARSVSLSKADLKLAWRHPAAEPAKAMKRRKLIASSTSGAAFVLIALLTGLVYLARPSDFTYYIMTKVEKMVTDETGLFSSVTDVKQIGPRRWRMEITIEGQGTEAGIVTASEPDVNGDFNINLRGE